MTLESVKAVVKVTQTQSDSVFHVDGPAMAKAQRPTVAVAWHNQTMLLSRPDVLSTYRHTNVDHVLWHNTV